MDIRASAQILCYSFLLASPSCYFFAILSVTRWLDVEERTHLLPPPPLTVGVTGLLVFDMIRTSDPVATTGPITTLCREIGIAN